MYGIRRGNVELKQKSIPLNPTGIGVHYPSPAGFVMPRSIETLQTTAIIAAGRKQRVVQRCDVGSSKTQRRPRHTGCDLPVNRTKAAGESRQEEARQRMTWKTSNAKTNVKGRRSGGHPFQEAGHAPHHSPAAPGLARESQCCRFLLP